MPIGCASQCVLCAFPIHIDTYRGCSHACKYCFAQSKTDISFIRPENCTEKLRKFIRGGRSIDTNWCDWRIPLHWGGLSDPFQPAERKVGVSLKALEVFRESQYPFIVSTKGKLIAEEPYLSMVCACNCVVQVSMLCPSMDRIERGAATFEERLGMLRKLSAGVDGKRSRRIVVRAQPYIRELRKEFLAQIPRMAEAGADAITVEGMKFKKRKPGTVRVGGDWCYPESALRSDYRTIRDECHRNGLIFLCAENRLRPMGDSPRCCCGDLDGFDGNDFNAVNIANGLDVKPTERMQEPGTGSCFKGVNQSAGLSAAIKETPFAAHMLREAARLSEAD